MTDAQPVPAGQPSPAAGLFEKPCSSCFSPIDRRATVCPKCRSFQGLYWWTRLVGVGSPWVIGALSLASLAYSNYANQFPHKPNPIKTELHTVLPGEVVLRAINPLSLPVYPEPGAFVRCSAEGKPKSNFVLRLREDTSQFSIPAHQAALIGFSLIQGSSVPDESDIEPNAQCYLVMWVSDGGQNQAENDQLLIPAVVKTLVRH